MLRSVPRPHARTCTHARTRTGFASLPPTITTNAQYCCSHLHVCTHAHTPAPTCTGACNAMALERSASHPFACRLPCHRVAAGQFRARAPCTHGRGRLCCARCTPYSASVALLWPQQTDEERRLEANEEADGSDASASTREPWPKATPLSSAACTMRPPCACALACVRACGYLGLCTRRAVRSSQKARLLPAGQPATHLLPDRRHRAHTWTGESVSADALQVEPYGAEELRVVLTHRKQAQASLERMAKAQQAACVED